MGNILHKPVNTYYDLEKDKKVEKVEKDKKISFLTCLRNYVYNILYSEKLWCFISHHGHIIDVIIEKQNKEIQLKPLEHYITTLDVSKKVLIVCEVCQIKKHFILNPSGIMYKDSEILYIPVD